MRVRDSVINIVFAWALLLCAPAFAVEISGKVTAVSGSSITIKVDSAMLPNVGDKVDVSFKTPDGEEIPVGVWRVSKVEGETIEATVVEAGGDPNVDMNVVIHSDQPRTREERIPNPRIEEPETTGSKKITSLNATLSRLRFYESRNHQLLPDNQRSFKSTFDPGSGGIWWEFTLDYNTSRQVDFVVNFKYTKQDGSTFGEGNFSFYLNPQEKQTAYTSGIKPQGNWPAGTYMVDIFINGTREISGSFVVAGSGGTPAQEKKRKLSSLNATRDEIRFYESNSPELPAKESRVYRSSFAPTSQFIRWELNFEYQTSQRIDFVAISRFYGPDGSLLQETRDNFFLSPSESSTWYSSGFKMTRGWPPGQHTVQVLINGVKEVTGTFQVR